MSVVTTVTIISSGHGKTEERRIKILNDWVEKHYDIKDSFKPLDLNQAAGNKCPQREIYFGGFNYLNVNEFTELFRSLKWEHSILVIGYEWEENGYVVVPSQNGTDTMVFVQTHVPKYP